MFKKTNGYYWVKQNETSKVGFTNVFKAIDYKYPAVSVIAMFATPVVIALSVIYSLSK